MFKNKEEILKKIKEVEERMKHETDEEQGVSETELSFLKINLQDLGDFE